MIEDAFAEKDWDSGCTFYPSMDIIQKNPDSKVILDSCEIYIKPGQKISLLSNESQDSTMFMMSLLNETDLVTGKYAYNGKISYANINNPLW